MKKYREFIAETNSRIYEAAASKKAKTPKAKKKPIVDWSKYDEWKLSLSPADAKEEEKRIADVFKRFRLSRSEREHWQDIERGFDGGHGPSPGSRWI